MTDTQRAYRRSKPLRAYVGRNGSGKTLAAVHDLLPSLDVGRTVYSTIALYDDATGMLHPNYIPFTRWEQLFKASHADFLLDEIVTSLSARESTSLHNDVLIRLQQLRKADLTLSWTAPNWKRADIALREVSQIVVDCMGWRPDRKAARENITDDEVAEWAPMRKFRWDAYDRNDFDEFKKTNTGKLRRLSRQKFWGPESRAFASYNTLESVDRIEAYDPDKCTVCGKKKRTEYCRGHDGDRRASVGAHVHADTFG